MKSIHIPASRAYDVLIGPGLLDEAGDRVRALTGAETAVIVAGDIVWPLYGERLARSLESAGLQVLSFVIPHGERSKTLTEYGRLLNFLAENRVTRGDVLLALGGGVTGDLTGFAAATYQRGLAYAQLPTTLLAAVDSSVGGKTAVDLDAGKNLAGAFYQPALVLCDTDTLRTLPQAELRNGSAEVIKYGLLGSADFLRSLRETPLTEQLEPVIARCVAMKRDYVLEDEFDRGSRQLLNLGHSVGHGVELLSGYSVPHGQAVAIGLAVITRAAVCKGLCPPAALETLLELLTAYGLPTETDFPVSDLSRAMLRDKKLSGGVLTLVVPRELGRCERLPVPAAEIGDWLRAGGCHE